MSKTVLANVDGFTPVMDIIAQSHGIMTALVFGMIWRYCQMGDNVCKASTQKIADRVGVSKRSVLRHIQILLDNGYLNRVSGGRGVPYVYQDTGKAALKISIEGSGDTESPVTESHRTGDRESPVVVTESHRTGDTESLKDRSKKHTKKQEERILTAQQAMVQALENVTGVLASLNGSRLGRSASLLIQAGFAPEQVAEWYGVEGWWYQKGNDFRGEKGQQPTPEQVCETIGRASNGSPVRVPELESLRNLKRWAKENVNDD